MLVRDMGDAQALSSLAHTLREEGKKVRIAALGHAAFKMLEADQDLAKSLVSPDTVKGVTSRLGDTPADLGGGKGHGVALAAPTDASVGASAAGACRRDRRCVSGPGRCCDGHSRPRCRRSRLWGITTRWR